MLAPVLEAEMTSWPGAKTSTQGPVLEKEATASPMVDAPMLRTVLEPVPPTAEGDCVQALVLELPAATWVDGR